MEAATMFFYRGLQTMTSFPLFPLNVNRPPSWDPNTHTPTHPRPPPNPLHTHRRTNIQAPNIGHRLHGEEEVRLRINQGAYSQSSLGVTKACLIRRGVRDEGMLMSESEDEEEVEILDEESELMAKMGLPVAFASSSEQKAQKKKRRPNRKPIKHTEELPRDKEVDKDFQQVSKAALADHGVISEEENQNDVHQVMDEAEEIHDTSWENYWVQNGQYLLWNSWLEKHPDTSAPSGDHLGAVTAPWNNPDTKALWDQLAAETYYLYWERFSYWTLLGWTTEPQMCNSNTSDEVESDALIQSEEQSEGKTGAGSLEEENEVIMSNLLRQNCMIEQSRSCAADLETNRFLFFRANVGNQSDEEIYCGEPSDAGDDQKEPAGSSQDSSAKQTASNQVAVLPQRVYGSNSKSSERTGNEEGDDDDKHPRRYTKTKCSHELDVEECPQLTLKEVWSKLGLKYKQTQSGIIINYKHFNGPRPKKTNKVVRSINKHTRFSEMDGDQIKSNQISPALYKVQNFLQNLPREAPVTDLKEEKINKGIKKKNDEPVEEERCIYESTSETKMMEDNECFSSSNFTERSVEEPRDVENPGRSLTFQEKLDLGRKNHLCYGPEEREKGGEGGKETERNGAAGQYLMLIHRLPRVP
ncbi:hypothetical protein CCH79_00017331, partial [Gambusia affinis]